MSTPIIVWFRRDLRVADNPALFNAAQSGKPVIPLFVFEAETARALGGASKVWLHHSLLRLAEDLKGLGLNLVVRQPPPAPRPDRRDPSRPYRFTPAGSHLSFHPP